MIRRRVLLLMFAALACGGTPPPAPADAGHAPPIPSEADTSIVRLDAVAVARLGLETAEVEEAIVDGALQRGGIVMTQPGTTIGVTAPLAGKLGAGDTEPKVGMQVTRGDVLMRLVPFAPADRDVGAQAQRQRQSTQARLGLAKARLERTRALFEQRGASLRAVEEAEAELATATAEDDAAATRERLLRKSPLAADARLAITAPFDGVVRGVTASAGQSIASGAPLFEVMSTSSLWVRVPIYPGDLDRLSTERSVHVARLGHDPFQGHEAVPVAAPPSADPIAVSLDLFYALPAATTFHPGERVAVGLTTTQSAARASVPTSSVVFDFDGGTWVYGCVDATSFERRRVEVLRHDDDRAVLGRGPETGTCIVSVGALELLGAEFGVSH